MTDLHCHILHDMDDGPAGLESSLALCRMATHNHIERVAATPHITDLNETDAFLIKRGERLEELKGSLAVSGIKIELFPGAEVLVNDGLPGTSYLSRLTLNHSRYLLVEFPPAGLNPHTIYRCITDIQNSGLIPILAHPERYAVFQRDGTLLNPLLQSGALLQIDAASLRPSRNRAEYRLAREMVRHHAASFIATDAHSVDNRPNNLLELIGTLSTEIDFDELDALVSRNPDAVLQDKVLDTRGRRFVQKRGRFCAW
jgi:protein-tyrosine phosphatase